MVDFGLAASRGESTTVLDVEETGLAAGTALYLAPERIRGQDFDARLDLYALGCMIYEAIAGEPAFLRPTVSQTLVAHVSSAIPGG